MGERNRKKYGRGAGKALGHLTLVGKPRGAKERMHHVLSTVVLSS
jgi:hypothetical protein